MASNVINKARSILRRAGVDQDMIDTILAFGDSAAQRIVDQPESAAALALKYPAANVSAYEEARAVYGFEDAPTAADFAGAGGPDAMARNLLTRKGYQTNKSGALLFPNGVIADPRTGQVHTPNDENVAGSFEWREKVQETWSDEQVAEWRKRLSDYGYDVADKGPIDKIFLDTLQMYHFDRYLNGGKAIPVDASARAGGMDPDEILTRPEVRNFVRETFRTGIGDDPSEDELKHFAKAHLEFYQRFMKKGMSAGRAQAAAEEKTIERFVTDPKVEFLQDAEEDNTELRDGLLGVLQTINSIARTS